MRGLQAMRRVRRPQLARLHHKSEQPRRQAQKKKRIAQPSSKTRSHRLDGIKSGNFLSAESGIILLAKLRLYSESRIAVTTEKY
jgi:hypothetical protein